MSRAFPERVRRLREVFVRSLSDRGADGAAGRACEALFTGTPPLPKTDLQALGSAPLAHLVAFDADRIRQFVFDSERPQVSGGASRILERANEAVLEGRGAPEGLLGCVYSAGGVGLLMAAGCANPEDLARQCRAWLERDAHGLSFTVVVVPLTAADLLDTGDHPIGDGRLRLRRGLQGVWARLDGLLRSAKESRFAAVGATGLPPLVPGRAAARCASCGRRAPNGEGRRLREDEGPWCEHCMAVRAAYVQDRAHAASIRYDELAARSSSRRRFLAFLSLDGNDMGRRLQELTSLSQLAAFSEAVAGVFAAARTQARDAVRSVAPDHGPALDPTDDTVSLLSGGDEVVLILPSAAAWQATRTALATVEREFSALEQDAAMRSAFRGSEGRLSDLAAAGASGGLVLSHPTFPVRLLRRYADALVKVAKGRLAQGARTSVCALVLTDASPLPELRSGGATRDAAIQELPSLAALDAFVREVRTAQRLKVPRAALQGIGRAVFEESSVEPVGAARVLANLMRYQLVRHKDTLGAWWNELHPDQDRSVEAWFVRPQDHRVQHLIDALALDPTWSAPA